MDGPRPKLIYIPAPFGPSEWDRLDPIGIILEGSTTDPTIQVRFKDNGSEQKSPPILLRALMQQNFLVILKLNHLASTDGCQVDHQKPVWACPLTS